MGKINLRNVNTGEEMKRYNSLALNWMKVVTIGHTLLSLVTITYYFFFQLNITRFKKTSRTAMLPFARVTLKYRSFLELEALAHWTPRKFSLEKFSRANSGPFFRILNHAKINDARVGETRHRMWNKMSCPTKQHDGKSTKVWIITEVHETKCPCLLLFQSLKFNQPKWTNKRHSQVHKNK